MLDMAVSFRWRFEFGSPCQFYVGATQQGKETKWCGDRLLTANRLRA